MIIVNVATSGTDPSLHSLMSIGAVDIESSSVFDGKCRVWDGARFELDSLLKYGFDENDFYNTSLKDPGGLLVDFLGWIYEQEGHKIFGGFYFTSSDLPFLLDTAKRYDHDLSDTPSGSKVFETTIDLHSVAYAKLKQLGKRIPFREGKYALDRDEIMEFVGLPENPNPQKVVHNALYEAEALHRLFHGKPSQLEVEGKRFSDYPVPEFLKI